MVRFFEQQQEVLVGLFGLGSYFVCKSYYLELLVCLEELEVECNCYKWLFEYVVYGIFQVSFGQGLCVVNLVLVQMFGYDDL